LNVYQVAPRRPILLATFTIDVGVDALTRGIRICAKGAARAITHLRDRNHSQYHDYGICWAFC
jgi:hypothetical protein